MDVRLRHVHRAVRDTNLYEFERLHGEPFPAFAPGAHIDVHLPNGLVRQYSLTRAEPNPRRYTVAIKRDAAGRGGSRYIHDEIHAGAALTISTPRNNFPLREDAAQVVFIAGGIGITPIWCMIQRLEWLKRPWTLYYACRSRADMAFRAPLAELAGAHLHFDDESGGKVLNVAAIVGAAPGEAHLYCCGPAPMLAAFEAAAAGWPRDQVHVEYFSAKPEPAMQGGFVVELARSGKEFFVSEGRSILDVLLDAGIDVPCSCQQGICGTCETRVVSGIPEHRDMILSEQEQASNTTVMICCAGSKTERLVLDL
jgi:ferredoxin-NADP reductase